MPGLNLWLSRTAALGLQMRLFIHIVKVTHVCCAVCVRFQGSADSVDASQRQVDQALGWLMSSGLHFVRPVPARVRVPAGVRDASSHG